jgi:hypothetical protein
MLTATDICQESEKTPTFPLMIVSHNTQPQSPSLSSLEQSFPLGCTVNKISRYSTKINSYFHKIIAPAHHSICFIITPLIILCGRQDIKLKIYKISAYVTGPRYKLENGLLRASTCD